jgi:carbamoyltransferase
MIIIGINAYHGDSSAALIINGKLVAAAEEERFRRIKHWAGFPSEAIKYCLSVVDAKISDVEHIALNQDRRANLFKKISFTVAQRPELRLVLDRLKNKQERISIKKEIELIFGRGFGGRIHEVEHHLAHLSSAFHVSKFEDAAIASIDGFGDFASAAWGFGTGSEILIDEKVYFPHSLGVFYQALTQWLGFPNYGDEYKVMGLAPYGKPKFLNEMRKIVTLETNGGFKLNLDYFRHHIEHVDYEWSGGAPKVGLLYREALIDLLGNPRKQEDAISDFHKDVARSVQTMYEEAFFNLLNAIYKKHSNENLCIAGGCAMNSVANGKVYNNTPYKKMYIQSAAGDAGGAIGSAFTVWHRLGGKRCFAMDHSSWGPEFSNETIKNLLEKNISRINDSGCVVEFYDDSKALCRKTAEMVSNGMVVGWFNGRMEWGPRALGNRSILGDPRRSNMKDILNIKIKRRESFRPFAPSILREDTPDWFEQNDDVPFMMQVFQVRSDKRCLIPAVTHVDGSGRLQTVVTDSNPRYYELISEFKKITGVPMVLNTSFNENEPIVCDPCEALDCFLRTKMDVLVLQNWMLTRGFKI